MLRSRPLLRRAARAALILAAASSLSGCALFSEAPAPAPAAAPSAFHTVQRGDTVFALAKRYDVSPAAIRDLNQLDGAYRIHVGQRLMLPDGGRGAVAVASARPAAAPRRPGVSQMAASARTARKPEVQASTFTPSRLRRPVEGEIIRDYGEGVGARRNKGVDIAADPGAPVLAAAAGKVAFVSDETSPVGAVVLMQHAGGMTTIYGRLARVSVRVGQSVSAGQAIAAVAPRAEGDPALHFELRRGSDPVNPTPYL